MHLCAETAHKEIYVEGLAKESKQLLEHIDKLYDHKIYDNNLFRKQSWGLSLCMSAPCSTDRCLL